MLVSAHIERKRDGTPLPAGAWRDLVAGYVAGRVPDYQMSALCMAVVWRGLEPAELAELTEAMRASGATLEWADLGRPVADKHSTGGVGDKTSLVLAPLLACCGLAVPMVSGRGLGHTGGTLDKLAAIPGMRTDLSLSEAVAQVRRLGVAMLGQTDEIAPADRRLYALRDVTGTVASVPLIAASIMSKKLAEGLDALVLDVKRGSGAFLPDDARARELAETMVAIGTSGGCRTTALLTAMDRPLGHACGNALEVEEAIAALRGEGPPDLRKMVLALGEEALLATGVAADRATAVGTLVRALDSGAALERFRDLVQAQGGNPNVVDDPAGLPQAPEHAVVEADRDGVVAVVAPRPLGIALIELGGGRRTMRDAIDPAVGFCVTAKPGMAVARGTPLGSVYARDAGVPSPRRSRSPRRPTRCHWCRTD